MDITLYISRFLYRIRYQIILGGFIVTALVAYFTQFLPKHYTVNTSIYTGIASNTGLNNEEKLSWSELNNTFDNIINLTKSKGTMEKVSLKLLALNLIHGDPNVDNTYITAENYKKLLKMVPKEIEDLIDKTSLEKTIENLNKYKKAEPDNFLFRLFNAKSSAYSYEVLKKVLVKRIGNSDIIDISFQSADPGIALHTVKLINEELSNVYDRIRYKSANDVVKYYEEQLVILRNKLNKLEDDFTSYNVDNGIINYQEQTKAISLSFEDYENRYEQILRQYESSAVLIEKLESKLDVHTKLFKTKEDFVKTLDDISTINGKITQLEIFNPTENSSNPKLDQYKEELKDAEARIMDLSNKMDEYQNSKEGVSIEAIIHEWLQQLIINTKAKAEMKVLDNRKKTYVEQYKTFSPHGTEINRKEREIRITEDSYINTLHYLNQAKLAQKNIQLTSATLTPIASPTYPLESDDNKRKIYVIGALLASIIFIIGCNLIIELLDRTLRDSERTQRLTGLPVLGAFTGNTQLKYRGFIKACNRRSAAFVCNRLNKYLKPGKTIYINLLSIENGEGKSFIAHYLIEQWEEQGFKVKYLIAEKDFKIDAAYLQMTSFSDLKITYESKPYDIVLIEHPSIQYNSLPLELLSQADANVLIANAFRVWKNSDDEFIKYLKGMVQSSPLFIYLNNATREAVEDFTGDLPPYISSKGLENKIVYFGFTAKSNSVK